MKNHNHDLTNSILMIAIAIILVTIFATSCTSQTQATPTVCTDYEAYKTVATVSINRSAATYSAYMQGRITYDDAELRTAVIYQYALRELSCEGIEEWTDVLKILRNIRDAIPAGKLSNPAIANMYIDDAFNRSRELNEDWGWDL